jgi:putative transposase
MPWGLTRFQDARCLHFRDLQLLFSRTASGTPRARDTFEETLEDTRKWYGLYVAGYVVMPEHVHLLLTEPERTKLSVALQMLKQNVARRLREPEGGPFWQPRYYDFNVLSYAKQTEKLRYIHRNPVRRGLVKSPEEWAWSSFRHYLSGVEAVVEIESQWTARMRERLGILPQVLTSGSQNPRPVAKGATRTGHR